MIISPVLGSGQARRQLVTVDFKNTAIKDAFKELNSLAGLKFMYSPKDLDENKRVSGKFVDKSIESVINFLLSGMNVTYSVKDNTIIIRKIQNKQGGVQQRAVWGKVTDESGGALEGVTISVKNTSVVTTTDVTGNYRIQIPQNTNVLVFTIVGFKTEEEVVEDSEQINVSMRAKVNDLEEVVVVGYGTQKKVNLTGSVSAINGEELAKRLVGQTSAALQGVLPGVTVTQRSGQPGADAGGIRIRGIGTLGDSNPLVLIDGVEGSMDNIDPTTIESVSVLKDAASSSIYGSRAANGVILITTKRMKEKGSKVNYSGYAGVKSLTNERDIVNAKDHMSLMNIAYENSGMTPAFDSEIINNYSQFHAADPNNYPDTDWQGLIYSESGLTQNHSVSINAGGDKLKLMAALGYYDEKGIVKNFDFKRHSLRVNSDYDISSKLSLRMDILLREMTQNEPAKGVGDVIGWGKRMPANVPAIYTNGQYGYGWQGSNPVAMINEGGYRENVTPAVSLNLGFDYKITDNLNVDFAYAPQYYESHWKSFSKTVTTYYPNGTVAYTTPIIDRLTHQNSRYKKNNVKATLNYQQNFNDHDIKVLLGWQDEDYSERWFSAARAGFNLPDYDQIDAGSTQDQTTGGSGSDWALRSFFGRANYNYKERYLFEANVRYDGSSRFAAGHKWGLFPSFSAGWRMSEESFWQPIKDVFNNLKFRASWGQLGNQNIGTYPYDSFVDLNINYIFSQTPYKGATLRDMANGEITWESAEMANLGLDFTLLDNFQFTFDYYVKNTNGILLRLDVPKIIGLKAPYQNAGKVRNKGWDLSIKYANKKNDFDYNIGLNLSDVKNKILDLKGIKHDGLLVSNEGYAMNSLYALEAEGYFSTLDEIGNHATQYGNYGLGDIKYKDQLTVDTDGDGKPDEGDGVINDDDKVIIGNTIPRFTFGFSTYLSWKNFDFNMLLQGVGKVDGYLYAHAVMPFYQGGIAMEMHKDYWTEDNMDAEFPRLTFNEPNNEKNSTFWKKNAAYLRAKNIQIGYTIPSRIAKRIGTDKIRVYLSGENLFSVDDFWNGFDVEAPVGEGTYYPQVRNFSVGLNLNF